jgi:hypothetical protein
MTDEQQRWASILGWHCWQGVAGLWYGRRLHASPPVIIRAETLGQLRAAIEDCNRDRSQPPAPPHPD